MSHELTRRTLIRTAAAGLAGAAGCSVTGGGSSRGDQDSPPGWIDAHVHVWTDDLERYPIAEGFTRAQMVPPRFTPEELFAHCEPCGVRRVNLIQMSYYRFDNRYMLDAMARYPGRFAGTAVVDPAAPDADEQMRRLASHGVRAFRIYPALDGRKPAQWLQPSGYEAMFQAGAAHNLAMSCLIDPEALHELDRMCTRHPDTPIIIDHLCRIGVSGRIATQDVEALCRMSRHRRVMVKIGAFYALGAKKTPYDDLLPLIQRVVEAFGPQRCMWETDCPFQVVHGTYEASLAVIRDRCDFLSPTDKQHILRHTAEHFFFG